MIEVIKKNRESIRMLCRKYDVKRLDLFGSAAQGDFDAASSDIDFFVEFKNYDAPTIADQWFGLQEELQLLLGAPVELVSARTATNPYFLQVANQHKIALYAA